MKKKTLSYFNWAEMFKLIKDKFGEKSSRAFWVDHMCSDLDPSNPRRGGIGHINLFYFGPREKDCQQDPEYAKQRDKYFNWTDKNAQMKLFKSIMHFIWDTLEEQLDPNDIEMCYFDF